NCILLFIILETLVFRDEKDRPYALFFAAIFCVHPLQTEPVIYISARSVLLVAAAFFCSVLAYVRYRRGGSVSWLAASVMFFMLSLFAKESAIPLAGFFALLEYHLSKEQETGFRAFPVALIWAAALCFAGLRFYQLSHAIVPSITQSYPQHWLTEVSVLPKYLRLALLPFGLSVDHEATVSWPGVAAGAAVIAATGYLVLHWRRKPLLLALLALPYLALMTEMLVPLDDKMVEYRMYLPLAGIAALLAACTKGWLAGRRLPISGRTAAAASAVVLVIVLGAISFARAGVWKDPIILWQDANNKYPGLARPYVSLGVSYGMKGDFRKSIGYLEKSVQIKPDSSDGWANLGNAYSGVHELKKAEECYRKALGINKADYESYYNLAQTLIETGRPQDAFTVLNEMTVVFHDDADIKMKAYSVMETAGQADLAKRLLEGR
ncbi:MAG TPA: tetratricopeptide repeat protein, partial [Nitrospirota bacterium]